MRQRLVWVSFGSPILQKTIHRLLSSALFVNFHSGFLSQFQQILGSFGPHFPSTSQRRQKYGVSLKFGALERLVPHIRLDTLAVSNLVLLEVICGHDSNTARSWRFDRHAPNAGRRRSEGSSLLAIHTWDTYCTRSQKPQSWISSETCANSS